VTCHGGGPGGTRPKRAAALNGPFSVGSPAADAYVLAKRQENPDAEKVTLKAVRTHADEEKNNPALQFQMFFFKDSLALLVI